MARGRLGAGKWPAVALVAACLLAAGCGGGSDESPSPEATTTSTTATPAAGTKEQAAGESGGNEVDLYFTAGEQFKKVSRELPPGGSPVEQAAKELIEDKVPGDTQTAIPEGVNLDGVTVGDDGTAVVEVSKRFLEGVPAEPRARSDADNAELNARLGQVTYTLTQFAKVESTKVVAGGVTVEPTADRGDFQEPEQGPEREAHPQAGAKSLATRDVQKRLAKLGYLPPGAVDGEPGYRTEQAVVAFQSWEGLERDGVVGPLTTAALAKAKRPKPRGGGPARRIEVYRDKGVALLVTHGQTRRAIHVSTGAPGTSTPAGTFSVFRKELRSWSVPFGVWLPYASYFNQGIAFHEYPDVPPFPASHGCVRVPAPEAEGVYKFAKLGTVVVVL